MTFNMNDLSGVKAHTGTRQTLDAGEYAVMISKADTADGKSQGAINAVMEYTVLTDGPFKGAVVKEWLAIVNKSETAQNIARSKLRAVQLVSKSENAAQVSDMVGKSIIIHVGREESEYVDREGNKRKGINNTVLNYLNMKRQDSDGNAAPVYNAPAPKVKDVAQEEFKSSRQHSAGSGSNNDDSDIPF
jgi:hypothetical protein